MTEDGGYHIDPKGRKRMNAMLDRLMSQVNDLIHDDEIPDRRQAIGVVAQNIVGNMMGCAERCGCNMEDIMRRADAIAQHHMIVDQTLGDHPGLSPEDAADVADVVLGAIGVDHSRFEIRTEPRSEREVEDQAIMERYVRELKARQKKNKDKE